MIARQTQGVKEHAFHGHAQDHGRRISAAPNDCPVAKGSADSGSGQVMGTDLESGHTHDAAGDSSMVIVYGYAIDMCSAAGDHYPYTLGGALDEAFGASGLVYTTIRKKGGAVH